MASHHWDKVVSASNIMLTATIDDVIIMSMCLELDCDQGQQSSHSYRDVQRF